MRLFHDPVELAKQRLRTFEPDDGYYGAFSGGKDSITMARILEESGVKYELHYQQTGVDPPELLYFMRKHYPQVIWHRPEKTLWQLIVEKQFVPLRNRRFCCEWLKERGGQGRTVTTGIRREESNNRRARKLVDLCVKFQKKMVHPIIDWSEADVWQFIRGRSLPYPSLYDEGFRRLGCICCPMAGGKGMRREARRWPRFHALYLRAFSKMLAERERAGKQTSWQTPEDVWEWWCSGKGAEAETPLFS